jgi:Cu/Ag efflux protein CusF
MRTVLTAVVASLALMPTVARAQKTVSQSDVVELTATIEAIDHDGRLITLRDKDGEEATVHAGPEVKRFDELKVGDTVTFRYYESIVSRIRKPGEPPAKKSASGDPSVVRGHGARPGATVSQQQTVTVTVKAIDPKVPSVTVVTDKGHTASFKVEDRKNIKDLKVGDQVEITYTEAVLISVK